MGKSGKFHSAAHLRRFRLVFATCILWAPSYGQTPQVKTWEDSSDGVRTQISITANIGLTPPPVLLIECVQAPQKKPSTEIYLVTGPLQPHPRVGLLNSVSEWLLLTKLDGSQPMLLSWVPTHEPGTYVYEGEGENGMPREFVRPKKFFKDLLAARSFDIEIQRQGQRGKYVASFDTSQLKQVLNARPECGSQ